MARPPPPSPPGPTSPLGSQGGEGCAGGAALPPCRDVKVQQSKSRGPTVRTGGATRTPPVFPMSLFLLLLSAPEGNWAQMGAVISPPSWNSRIPGGPTSGRGPTLASSS